MNRMAAPFGGWILVHCLANSIIGIRVRSVLPAAVFTAFWQFPSIVQFVDKLVQRNCKNSAAFKASFLSNGKQEITPLQGHSVRKLTARRKKLHFGRCFVIIMTISTLEANYGGFCMSIMSLISFAVSILGTVIYGTLFSGSGLTWLFVILSIAAIVLPPIAKKLRITQEKKGKVLEIIAIVIGGFNFYCIIFALTTLPIFIGYLGWVISGVAYKIVK